MLRLRPYKPCDAQEIVTWCKDEIAFHKWSADRLGSFPLSADYLNQKYTDDNGDCKEPDNFFPMTAFDENGVAGHLIMRFLDKEKKFLRFGFIIVNENRRGCGYGKKMLQLALKYAFEILKVENVSLGVFANNMPAYHCYRAAGFQEAATDKPVILKLCGEDWRIIELEVSLTSYPLLQSLQ